MWNVEPTDVSVTYHPDYTIELATPEKVQEIVEDFLNAFGERHFALDHERTGG